MYIDMSSVDQLMKSTIENKLFSNHKKNNNYSASFYIRQKAAIAMLEHVMKRNQKSSGILEKAASAMLVHVMSRKKEFGGLELIGRKN